MRPDFLTSPGTWLRASRIAQTRAEYAEPIEHCTPRTHRADWAMLAVFAAFLVLAAWGLA